MGTPNPRVDAYIGKVGGRGTRHPWQRRLQVAAALGSLLLPLRGSAQERAAFLFELNGVPVGTVELSLDAGSGDFHYRSSHLFTRAGERSKRVREAKYSVDSEGRDRQTGRAFESLWLWRGGRTPGCVEGREELGERKGLLCVTDASASAAAGTAFGQEWRAKLDARSGELMALRLGAARFTRVGTVKVPPPPDLFAAGLPVGGDRGALAVRTSTGALLAEPEVPVGGAQLRPFASEKAARALSSRVHGSFEAQHPSEADFAHDEGAKTAGCLGHARRFIAWANRLGFDAFLVHGLVAEAGARRAYPHAWVRVRTPRGWLDLDPTLGVEPSGATHVAIGVVDARTADGAAPADGPGARWLRLIQGEWTLTRAR